MAESRTRWGLQGGAQCCALESHSWSEPTSGYLDLRGGSRYESLLIGKHSARKRLGLTGRLCQDG